MKLKKYKLLSFILVFIMIITTININTFATNVNNFATVIVNFNGGVYNDNGIEKTSLNYSIPIGESKILFNKKNICYLGYEYSGYTLNINNKNGNINSISSSIDGNIIFNATDNYTYTINIQYDTIENEEIRDYALVNIHLNGGTYIENNIEYNDTIITTKINKNENIPILNLSNVKKDNFYINKIEQSNSSSKGISCFSLVQNNDNNTSLNNKTIYFEALDTETYDIYLYWSEKNTIQTPNYAIVNVDLNGGICTKNGIEYKTLSFIVNNNEIKNLFNLNDVIYEGFSLDSYHSSCSATNGTPGSIYIDENKNVICSNITATSYDFILNWVPNNEITRNYAIVNVDLNGGIYNDKKTLTFNLNKNENKTLFNLDDIIYEGYYISSIEINKIGNSDIQTNENTTRNVVINNVDNGLYNIKLIWSKKIENNEDNNYTKENNYATINIDFNGGTYNGETTYTLFVSNGTTRLINVDEIIKEGYMVSSLSLSKDKDANGSIQLIDNKYLQITTTDTKTYNIIIEWEKINEEEPIATLNINLNGGTYKNSSSFSQKVQIGEKIVLNLEDFYKEGYDFASYKLDVLNGSVDNVIYNKDNNEIIFSPTDNGNYSINIIWNKKEINEDINKGKVSIYTNDNTNQIITIDLSNKSGETIDLLDITKLTKTNYTLDNWNVSKINGNSTVSLNGNILQLNNVDNGEYIITLNWVKNNDNDIKQTSTLTFDLNGGTYKNKSTYSIEVEIGKTITFNVSDFNKDGYSFKSILSTFINNEITMSSDYKTFTYKVNDNSDTNIKILWEKNNEIVEKGKVVINLNNGDPNLEILLDGKQNVTLLDLNLIKKDGYKLNNFKITTKNGKGSISLVDNRYLTLNNADNGIYEIELIWEKINYNTKKTISIGKGEKISYKIPSQMSGTITYTIDSKSKKNIKLDKNGNIKGLKVGTATVVIKDSNGLKHTLTIKVKKAPTKITIKSKTIKKNKSITLKPIFKSGEYSYNIKWTSSNIKIAKVNSKGVVVGKKKGTCYITAKTFNNKKIKVKIIVK